MTANYMFFNL